jgi:hypothetical protein
MQSNKFSGTISKSFGKVKKRLIKEMIYGIQLQFVTRLKMSRYLHFGKNINRQVKAECIDRHVELNHKVHIYISKEGK